MTISRHFWQLGVPKTLLSKSLTLLRPIIPLFGHFPCGVKVYFLKQIYSFSGTSISESDRNNQNVFSSRYKTKNDALFKNLVLYASICSNWIFSESLAHFNFCIFHLAFTRKIQIRIDLWIKSLSWLRPCLRSSADQMNDVISQLLSPEMTKTGEEKCQLTFHGSRSKFWVFKFSSRLFDSALKSGTNWRLRTLPKVKSLFKARSFLTKLNWSEASLRSLLVKLNWSEA